MKFHQCPCGWKSAQKGSYGKHINVCSFGAACELVGKTISGASFEGGHGLTLWFEDGTCFELRADIKAFSWSKSEAPDA